MTDDDVYFHFLEYQGAYQGVKYDQIRANKLAKDQEVNEYAMRYGFVAGQMYAADWDISPEGQDGDYVVQVPLNIFAAEMAAK